MSPFDEPDIFLYELCYVSNGAGEEVCRLIIEHAGEYGSYYLPIYKSPVMPKKIKPPTS